MKNLLDVDNLDVMAFNMYVISRLSKDRAKSLKENNGNEELISVLQQIGEVSERISEKAKLL